ncbi:hypothetical protein [Actinomyces trachealis]|uniref:hypothetical protein n=1 Tax=Actinomyces trachealis TaxID=2763540 RepID=UPI0018929C48|nr:hypothetical protein [Actinomyces trachealis]
MSTTPASPSAHTPEVASTKSLPTMPLPQAPAAGATNATDGVGALNHDGVWSANRPDPMAPVPVSTTIRSGTITWGVFLAVLGLLLIAIGVGMPLDLTKISIGVIGGLGVLLLVLAFVPRRKDEKA